MERSTSNVLVIYSLTLSSSSYPIICFTANFAMIRAPSSNISSPETRNSCSFHNLQRSMLHIVLGPLTVATFGRGGGAGRPGAGRGGRGGAAGTGGRGRRGPATG